MGDPHTGAPQLVAQRVGEGADRGLGGGVHGLVAHRDAARQRPDEHHPPRARRHHPRQQQPHQAQRGQHVDVEDLVDGVRGHVQELPRPAHPGPGHQQVHRARGGRREVGELPVGSGEGEVGREGGGRGVVRDLTQPHRVASGEHQPPALLVAQPAGHGRADSGGRPGHERRTGPRLPQSEGSPPGPRVVRVGCDDLRAGGGAGTGERMDHEDHLGSGRTAKRPTGGRASPSGRTGGHGVSPAGRPKRPHVQWFGGRRRGVWNVPPRQPGPLCTHAAPRSPATAAPGAVPGTADVCW